MLCALNAAVDDVPGPSGYVGVGIEKTLSSTIKLQDVEGNFWKSLAKAHLATSIGSQSKCGFTGLSWFFKTEALADLRHDEDEMNRRFKRYAKEFNVSTVRDVGVYTVCFCVFHALAMCVCCFEVFAFVQPRQRNVKATHRHSKEKA